MSKAKHLLLPLDNKTPKPRTVAEAHAAMVEEAKKEIQFLKKIVASKPEKALELFSKAPLNEYHRLRYEFQASNRFAKMVPLTIDVLDASKELIAMDGPLKYDKAQFGEYVATNASRLLVEGGMQRRFGVYINVILFKTEAAKKKHQNANRPLSPHIDISFRGDDDAKKKLPAGVEDSITMNVQYNIISGALDDAFAMLKNK